MARQCPKCKIIGAGVRDNWGYIIPCKCLPSGKTCKDCKFEKQCLLEGIIEGPETVCKEPYERGFAEHGQLSYREFVRMKWEEEAREAEQKRREEIKKTEEKIKTDQMRLAGKIWTEQMLLESILPRHLRKVYTMLPGSDQPLNFVLEQMLEKHNEPLNAAREYMDVFIPGWRNLIGERLPEHLREVVKDVF